MAHVTFIHGILNKPEPGQLLRNWRAALARAGTPFDLGAEGVTSEMVYWADVLYEAPLDDAANESAQAEDGLDGAILTDPEELPTELMTAEERAWVKAFEHRLGLPVIDALPENEPLPDSAQSTVAKGLERIPLPWFVKRRFMQSYLRDVHHYLFNETYSPRPGASFVVQDEIRGRFLAALERGAARPGPHIVVSHSMGTVIAYDCLKRVADCPAVDHLITLGSPLGIDEIQDKLQPEWTRDNGFPFEKVRGGWSNFFDPLDVVSRLDPYLASDYRRNGQSVVHDGKQSGTGIWRHNIDLYLSGRDVSADIIEKLGMA